MLLGTLFNILKTAHMLVTAADLLVAVVAVEGCGPDLAVNAVQHSEYSTDATDKSRHACRIGCCWLLVPKRSTKRALVELRLGNSSQQHPTAITGQDTGHRSAS